RGRTILIANTLAAVEQVVHAEADPQAPRPGLANELGHAAHIREEAQVERGQTRKMQVSSGDRAVAMDEGGSLVIAVEARAQAVVRITELELELMLRLAAARTD